LFDLVSYTFAICPKESVSGDHRSKVNEQIGKINLNPTLNLEPR
jgi:hypothetical protein